MGLGEVVVNGVARLGGCLIAETDLPRGTLRTPTFIPKAITQDELTLLIDAKRLTKRPEAVCYEISGVQRLTAWRAAQAKQRTITGKSADPGFEDFRTSVLAMTDPQTEFFSYRRTYNPKDETKTYLRQRIAALEGFPLEVRKMLNAPNAPWDETLWEQVISEELHLALIDWYARHQSTSNPAIFLPPTNVISGSRSLEASLALNGAAGAAFPPGEDRLVPAAYFILHPKIFKSSEFMNRLFKDLSGLADGYRILALKFLFPDVVLGSPSQCGELSRFLSRLDGLKRQLDDSILVMAIDAREEGLAMLANGLDAYAEPMSGFVWFPQARAKSREARAREAEDLDLEAQAPYWLNPRLRVVMPMSREELGRACDCPAHGAESPKLGQRAPPAQIVSSGATVTAPGLELRTDDERLERKAHLFNLRTREIEMLVEAAANNDLGFVARVLQAGNNRNLLKLLPAPNVPGRG